LLNKQLVPSAKNIKGGNLFGYAKYAKYVNSTRRLRGRSWGQVFEDIQLEKVISKKKQLS